MKTYELFIEEDGCTRIMGEIIMTSDNSNDGNTKWEVYWGGGSFIFYGGKQQLKAVLNNMAPNFIIGKEVK
tara:strand:+ start:1047 stop:1259 length:213 start_codon:yes stop_codon:yes gene_type:complete